MLEEVGEPYELTVLGDRASRLADPEHMRRHPYGRVPVLEDEGTSTLMKFHESTKVDQSLPVPDGVIKQVIRGVFLAQLEGLKKALNVNEANSGDDTDEP